MGDDLFVRCAHLSGSFGFGPSGMFLEIFRVFFFYESNEFQYFNIFSPHP